MKKDELENHLRTIRDLGFIGDDQFINIQENYVQSLNAKPMMDTLLLIFGLLGVAFAGIGTISLFAINWSSFSLLAQTIISVVPLICLQVLLFIKVKGNASNLWVELLSLGVGIALVAAVVLLYNTYQLHFPYEYFILGCILLLAPLVYALNAYYLAIAVFIGYFYYYVAFGYRIAFDEILFILGIFIPHYILRRKKQEPHSIYSFLMAAWLLLLPTVLELGNELYIVLFGMCLFALLNFDIYVKYVSKVLVYALLLFFAVFSEPGSLFLSADSNVVLWVVAVGTIVLYIVFRCKHGLEVLDYRILFSFVLVCVVGFIFSATSFDSELVEFFYPFLFKALLLIVSVLKILQALKVSYFARITRYLLAISMYGFLEAVASDLSLMEKGVLLILIGLGFFITNYIFSKRMQNET